MTPEQLEAHIELCRRDPMYFRETLIIDGASRDPKQFGSIMVDFQRRDFNALDPTLKWLSGQKFPVEGGQVLRAAEPSVRRFFIQRGRGSSKTSDLATCFLWLLAFAVSPLDMIVAAEDREQSSLIKTQAAKIIHNNPWLDRFVTIQRSRMINQRTGAMLTCVPRDKWGSFGITPDVVMVDEFTHITDEGFWESLLSSFGKKQGALIIACNAGAGVDWKYRVKEHAADSPDWYHSAPDGYAPWYSEKMIEEQRALLSSTEFARLWMNRWQASLGEFVTLEEADACSDRSLKTRTSSESGYWYVASLDYAEKCDRTVGCVCHIFDGEIIVDRMDVADPEQVEGGVIRLEWCEQWIRTIEQQFGGDKGTVFFVLDKYQLLYLVQSLPEEGFEVEAFEFKSGIGNWEIGQILRQLILQRKIRWPEGCGAIPTGNGLRDDLCTELSSLVVKHTQSGRWRFDHSPGEHDDRAFALGACARFIVMNCGGLEQWGIAEDTRQTNPLGFTR